MTVRPGPSSCRSTTRPDVLGSPNTGTRSPTRRSAAPSSSGAGSPGGRWVNGPVVRVMRPGFHALRLSGALEVEWRPVTRHSTWKATLGREAEGKRGLLQQVPRHHHAVYLVGALVDLG